MVRQQIRLSQAIEGFFIAAHARRLAPGTLRDYDTTLRCFEAHLGDDPALEDITAEDIRDFMKSLDGLSAKALTNYHVGLSVLWTWAINEDLCHHHVPHAVEQQPTEH